MQGKNGDTDVKNGLVDPVGEGESGTYGDSSINIYTLSCVKWVVGEKLTGSPVWVLCDALEGREGGKEGGSRGLICLVVWQKPTQHDKN